VSENFITSIEQFPFIFAHEQRPRTDTASTHWVSLSVAQSTNRPCGGIASAIQQSPRNLETLLFSLLFPVQLLFVNGSLVIFLPKQGDTGIAFPLLIWLKNNWEAATTAERRFMMFGVINDQWPVLGTGVVERVLLAMMARSRNWNANSWQNGRAVGDLDREF
jgi:hypothetical protein